MNSDQTLCNTCEKTLRSPTDIFHFINQILQSKSVHTFFCSFPCWNTFLKEKNQPSNK